MKIGLSIFYALCFLFASIQLSAESSIEKMHFALTNDPIDVIIPCAPKDVRTLEKCIKGIKQNGMHVRRVIVVSKEKLTEQAEWFREDAFPFTKEEIALEIFRGNEQAASQFVHQPESRIGWLFQQFLKLYALFVIPDLSPNLLVLDADVIFFRPVSFMDSEGNPYFTPSDEPYHAPYFTHGARLLSGWHRVHAQVSGIAHHMLFQKPILEDLFQKIREEHEIEPWKAICRVTDLNDIYFAGLSEYEIYFNYTLLRTSQGTIRPLRWTLCRSIHHIQAYQHGGYSFICCPTWLSQYH
jgi:hypothetical protein